MGTPGIALAASLAAWATVAAMVVLLARRGHLPIDERCRRRLPRLLIAAAGMGGALYWGTGLVDGFAAIDLATRVALLTAAVLLGAAVFFALAQGLGGADLREVRAALRRKRPPS
jgi:putative peptidoglycan lipid II flippase